MPGPSDWVELAGLDWILEDEDYVEKFNTFLQAIRDNAVHWDDIPGAVALGGDPTTVPITALKNGGGIHPQLAEYEVPGRAPGAAANSQVSRIHIGKAQFYAAVMALQNTFF